MSTNPSERMTDHISFEDLQKKIEGLSFRISKTDDLTGALQALVILELTKALSDPRTPEKKDAFGDDLAFSGDNIRLAKGHVMNVQPANTDRMPQQTQRHLPPKESSEATPERILSRFDFSRLDAEKNCLIEHQDSFVPLEISQLEEWRRQAVPHICRLANCHNLIDLPYFGESNSLRDYLVNVGFIEGRVKISFRELDVLTVNVLVLLQALEKKILKLEGSRINFAPGKSFVFYTPHPSGNVLALRQNSDGTTSVLNPQY